ncbi:MAG: TIGR02186 family protein [Geminicoccaceae bacterium]
MYSYRPANFIALIIISIVMARLGLLAETARANGLAADVSERLIAITTAFVGDSVVVFGSMETDGPIVITMEGPNLDQTVRRKSRIAGIWINRDRVVFKDAPSFYAIATSQGLNDIASVEVRDRLNLGVEHLKLEPMDGAGYSAAELDAFAAALIRNKQKQGLYTDAPEPVNFPGPRLFRTTFSFPANVPPGLYRIQVFQLKDGQVTGAQQSSLQISKIGMEAEVFDFAQENAALYGIVAIIIAVASGWLAGVIFRRA